MNFQSIYRIAALLLLALAAPQMAQAQAPNLDLYGDLAAIERASVSPNGEKLALLVTAGGDRQILVLDASGTPIKQFLVGDERVRSIDWAGEEAVLLYRTETSTSGGAFGTRKFNWLRGNVFPLSDEREPVSIFGNQNAIGNTLVGRFGVRQINNRWKGYYGGYRMGRTSGEQRRVLNYRPYLYEVDLVTGDAKQIATPADDDEYRGWVVDGNGAIAASIDVDYDTGEWELKGVGGREIATGIERNGRIGLIGLSRDRQNIILSVYDESEQSSIRYSVALADGTETQILDGVQIDRFIVDSSDATYLGYISSTGKPVLNDPDKQAVLEKITRSFSRSNLDIIDWSPDFNTVVVRTSGNGDSGTWYRLNVAEGKAQVLGGDRPAITQDLVGAISTISYKASDGLDLDGILTLPPGVAPQNLPVIIMPHGGPNAHDEPEFDWKAQAFASRGYAVFQPNFRGSTNRDETFRRAGDGEWGGKMQTDISDGLAALAEIGLVDAGRACIVGSSYGGYAALYGVTLQNGIYRCAVSVNGVADMDAMFASDLSGRSDLFSRNVNALIGKGVNLNSISPAAHAGKADAPVLLIHGREDTTVPFEQSVLMEDKLKDADKTVKFIKLDGEDHFLSRAETRKTMLEQTVAFVEKHNPAN